MNTTLKTVLGKAVSILILVAFFALVGSILCATLALVTAMTAKSCAVVLVTVAATGLLGPAVTSLATKTSDLVKAKVGL